jgi:hypothetical protein
MWRRLLVTQLRVRGFVLIAWLALAYLIAPQLPGAYVPLQTIVLLTVLLLPVERISAQTLLLGILAANLLAYAAERVLGTQLGDPLQYIAQLALTCTTGLLIRRVRYSLRSLEHGVWRFMLDGGLNKVRPWTELYGQALGELQRGRRYGRALSLILIDVVTPAPKPQANSTARLFNLHEGLVAVVQLALSHMRTIDMIAWSHKPGRLVLILPETEGEAARQFADRFAAVVQRETEYTVRYSIAGFPEHALTLEDLYQRAEAALEQRLTDNDYRLPVLAAREHRS